MISRALGSRRHAPKFLFEVGLSPFHLLSLNLQNFLMLEVEHQ